MATMDEALSGLVMLIAGWLLLGPTILIALSRRVRGAKKVTWAIGAMAPIILAVLGIILATHAYPESPFHIHSNHFPTAFLFSTMGVWGVYIAFRRRYVPNLPPNSTIERDARKSGARPSL
jgi:formate hydrogenlyase subunit 3/multisubunit Na+/H+ antiporter MnhD subunit